MNTLLLEATRVSSDSIRALFRQLASLKVKYHLNDILIETNYCDDAHLLSLNNAGQHTDASVIKIFVPVEMPASEVDKLVGDTIDILNAFFKNRITIVKSSF